MKIPKLFNNPGKAIVAILLVITLFVAYKAKATEIELGPTYTGEFNGGAALTLSERFADKIDVGVAIISAQSWERVNIGNNGNFWFAYVAERPDTWWKPLPSEVHIGGAYWFKTQSPINGCKESYLLGLKWRFGDHASVGIRHWSNAGICSPNRGQDLLTFGWRF
jgi:hypothetical protein